MSKLVKSCIIHHTVLSGYMYNHATEYVFVVRVFVNLLCQYLLSLLERSARVMHLGLFVCLRNSKTIAPIDLIFVHKKCYTRGSVLLKDDPDRDRDLDS